MGLGITVCPKIAIQEELESKELILLQETIIEKETSMIMIRHAGKWCSPILARFLEISKTMMIH